MSTSATRFQEIQRRAAREELERAALALFLERGYGDTTVDDVAAAAGVSRRTVFRYVETKEDLLLASMRDTGLRLAEALAVLPQETSAWAALSAVLLEFADEFDAGLPLSRQLARLLATTPDLQAGLALKHQHWQAMLGDAVAPRLTSAVGDSALLARALAATALACLDTAATQWALEDAGSGLRSRLRELFEQLPDQLMS